MLRTSDGSSRALLFSVHRRVFAHQRMLMTAREHCVSPGMCTHTELGISGLHAQRGGRGAAKQPYLDNGRAHSGRRPLKRELCPRTRRWCYWMARGRASSGDTVHAGNRGSRACACALLWLRVLGSNGAGRANGCFFGSLGSRESSDGERASTAGAKQAQFERRNVENSGYKMQ